MTITEGPSKGAHVSDKVNHPKHYNSHPSGVECLTVVRHMNFLLGNAVKYLWRAGLKEGADEIEDLKKAVFYIQDEIKLREGRSAVMTTGEKSIQGQEEPTALLRYWPLDTQGNADHLGPTIEVFGIAGEVICIDMKDKRALTTDEARKMADHLVRASRLVEEWQNNAREKNGRRNDYLSR
jgi:hypothetical protein